MPGKHEHHHGPNGHKPKHDGPPRGPKERELAVALTVAVLRTYNRMLDGITDAPAFAPALPPTATIGTSN